MAKILPSLVLTVICVVASALLVFAHELTKENIAKQKEQKFSSSVEALFGKTDSKLVEGDFGDGIEAVAVTPNGRTAIQVVADGYSKGGINILVGIDENGKISGIEFVSLGETPGLGSKVRDIPEFRERFYGSGSNAEAAAVDGISGATFSSKGMMKAVGQALDAYNNNKEAILNG
ncbi:MAG: FMN-binding protein [Ruminococcus sp.]|nr:FMN-binding protein [Ruminococcus sp.]